jgi:Catalytic LigB subunit of aromatic ring-opening dioxygenase
LARIVVGIGSSHTPQLSSGVGMWEDHAERDRNNPELLGLDGEFHTYDELLAVADPGIGQELAPDVWERKYHRGQQAVAELTRRLAAARVDVALVIGDDQREMFRDEGTGVFGFFLGDELVDRAPEGEALERVARGIRAAYWARYGERPTAHRTSAALSRHLVSALVSADFDVLTFTRQQPGTTLGHAFTFPRYRLALPERTPIVPVFINTYVPPNVPSAGRCYRLGQVIGQAVKSWPQDARVAVIASGGLSHFVVNEDLDRRVLDALVAGDAAPLCAIPRGQLRSGTSEILNWIAAAGALEGLRASVADYIPGYRSPAGTGAGMAFVYWE